MPRNTDRLASCTCAGLLAAISSIVLAGWILHLPLLTRVNPAFTPTQFNTALCFFVYGGGILADVAGQKWLPRAIGAAICVIGAVTLSETILCRNFGIDTVFG